jgi:predicted dehydrogenase
MSGPAGIPAAGPGPRARRRPRLGFAGVGWIGRRRLEAIVDGGAAVAAAIADPLPDVTESAARVAPDAVRLRSLHELLALDLDGVVIATPSAMHADQCLAALEKGRAVFCQKPLGRDAGEVRRVVEAARARNLLLGVDLSYRETRAARAVRDLVQSRALGRVFAAELVFHNAYGPDKRWFYDRRLSGGGCVIDLGLHLVDLALWVLGFPAVRGVSSRLFAGGRPLPREAEAVEDFAEARLDLETGAVVRLACSWRLSAGQDAVIGAAFHGTDGGAALRNVGGSFYDFVAERFRGTTREVLVEGPDAWGGRTARGWAQALAAGCGFDRSSERLVDVAVVLDRIYGSGLASPDERM